MFKFTHNGSEYQHEIHITTDNYGKFMDLLEIAVSMTDSDRREYANAMTSVEVPKEDVENVPCEVVEKPNKPKFKLEDYIDDDDTRYVMHCATEEDAKTFCDFLDASGEEWGSGETYLNNTKWEAYKADMCYVFNQGCYCSYDYFSDSEYYSILEFNDFDWTNGKPKFNFDDYKAENCVCMCCHNQKDYEKFNQYVIDSGRETCVSSYIDFKCTPERPRCIYFFEGCSSSLSYAMEEDEDLSLILYYEDFDWSEDKE